MMGADPRELLMSEVARRVELGQACDHVEAWRQVLNRPRKPDYVAAVKNNEARGVAFGEVALSPQQSSIARTKPGRQIIDIPMPERKPGEDENTFYMRIRRQIQDLAQPAGRTKGESTAASQDAGRPDVTLAAEQHYRELRAAALAKGRSTPSPPPGFNEAGFKSDLLRTSALGIMRSRGQSTNPKAKEFSENYKAALGEAAKGSKR
jgi:hypothetical protein